MQKCWREFETNIKVSFMSGEVINDVRFHRGTHQGRAGKCPWDLVTRKLQISLKIEVMGHFDNCSNKLDS